MSRETTTSQSMELYDDLSLRCVRARALLGLLVRMESDDLPEGFRPENDEHSGIAEIGRLAIEQITEIERLARDLHDLAYDLVTSDERRARRGANTRA